MQTAVKVSHPLPCFYYVCTNTSSSIYSIRGRRASPVAYLCRRPKLKFVDRVVSNCLSQKTPVGTDNTENDPVTKPVGKEILASWRHFFRFWSSESIYHLFCGEGNIWKIDELASEILAIALPAALALAADPIASLVDSAFVGHLGSVELAAVGVSISVFNLVSKLFNVPLLNITTSFVAEEQALVQEGSSTYQIATGNNEGKKLLPAVSTSLALATVIGIAEMVVLSAGSGSLMNVMGITVDSPMRAPAEQFLTLRAFGAPPLVIALAVQGTFRGFKDTKTPLYAVGIGNLLNAILDPILIFLCGIGISGGAVATVISEYVIAFILLVELNSKVVLAPPIIDLVEGVRRFVKSGGLLTGRSIAVLATMTFATSMAARLGPIPMAGHQICLQVWLAVSLLNDALALGGQALLAEAFAQGNYKQGRHVIFKVLQIGVVTGVALAIIMLIGFGPFSSIFSNDPAVLKTALSGVMFVAGSQPINALAFVIDGLYYGLSDFEYAAYSMIFAGLISSLFLLVAAPLFGLVGIWTGLILFMTLRVLAGFWRKDGLGGIIEFINPQMRIFTFTLLSLFTWLHFEEINAIEAPPYLLQTYVGELAAMASVDS